MTLGLTTQMLAAFNCIIHMIGLHGMPPSVRALADELDCGQSNAQRFCDCLIERGYLFRTKTGDLGIGGMCVPVMVPNHIASALARHCEKTGDDYFSVVADALTLHLDAAENAEYSSTLTVAPA